MDRLPNRVVSQQSIINKNPTIFNKTATCSHHCPLRHPAPSLGHWHIEVYLWISDPGTSHPTTFLGPGTLLPRWLQAVYRKMKMMKLQYFLYFCIFMYIWWLHNFLVFICGKLTKPCGQPAKYYQQKPHNFNKTATCSHPSGTQRLSLGHLYTGYTFGSLIQARAIPPPSWSLGLCSPGDYRQSIEFPNGQNFGCGVYLPSDICWML